MKGGVLWAGKGVGNAGPSAALRFAQDDTVFSLLKPYARSMLMTKLVGALLVFCVALSIDAVGRAQVVKDPVVLPSATGAQTETDEYTRYELLAPEKASSMSVALLVTTREA